MEFNIGIEWTQIKMSIKPRAIIIIFTIMISCKTAFAAVSGEAEPYTLIVKKNLFSPDRKEWIMEKSDSKADDAKKMLPKIDPKQIQLSGTIIVGNTRKAIITNALKSMGKAGGANAETYMVGDYLEGYLIKEIEEIIKMVLSKQKEELLWPERRFS